MPRGRIGCLEKVPARARSGGRPDASRHGTKTRPQAKAEKETNRRAFAGTPSRCADPAFRFASRRRRVLRRVASLASAANETPITQPRCHAAKELAPPRRENQ